MGSKVVSSSLLLILLLLITTHEELGGSKDVLLAVEARECESQSHGFKGQCWSDHNCRMVCANERFRGGKCRGVRKRCFCTNPC